MQAAGRALDLLLANEAPIPTKDLVGAHGAVRTMIAGCGRSGLRRKTVIWS
jgi:hypothetical protein